MFKKFITIPVFFGSINLFCADITFSHSHEDVRKSIAKIQYNQKNNEEYLKILQTIEDKSEKFYEFCLILEKAGIIMPSILTAHLEPIYSKIAKFDEKEKKVYLEKIELILSQNHQDLISKSLQLLNEELEGKVAIYSKCVIQ